ncbi:MAG: helix-turn-helix domain-containing protein [Proteobacteria bacterium]|nr:helix-turn-helix domain-containing protein [Pseudomonadota bacterium]
MRSKGVKAAAIAKELGIGRASVYRILADIV